MATPAPVVPPSILTRAQYLQLRENIRTLTAVARNMNLSAYVSTIDQAVTDGPTKNPKMWSEGHSQLVTDRALAAALAVFAKGT